MERKMEASKKLKVELPYNLVIPLLVATLFTIAKF
jgi:hypothetical protein